VVFASVHLDPFAVDLSIVWCPKNEFLIFIKKVAFGGADERLRCCVEA